MKFWTKLTRKQTRNLLKEPGWTLDYELTDSVAVYGDSAYLNSDGRTLIDLVLDGGNLFKSRADCLRYIEELEEAMERARVEGSLSHLIPQGRNFVNQVPQLIDELALAVTAPTLT